MVLEEQAVRAPAGRARPCARTGRTRGACRAGTRRARRRCGPASCARRRRCGTPRRSRWRSSIRSGSAGSSRTVCRHSPPPPGCQRGRCSWLSSPLIRLPRFSPVARLEQRRGLDATVKRVRCPGPARSDLPDLRDSAAGVVRETNASSFARGPGLAVVVARPHTRAPVHAVRCREGAGATGASVMKQRVDRLAAEMRAVHFPFLPRFVGAKHERALHGADEEQGIRVFPGFPASLGHSIPHGYPGRCPTSSGFRNCTMRSTSAYPLRMWAS